MRITDRPIFGLHWVFGFLLGWYTNRQLTRLSLSDHHSCPAWTASLSCAALCEHNPIASLRQIHLCARLHASWLRGGTAVQPQTLH
jgi:hypothetical protein